MNKKFARFAFVILILSLLIASCTDLDAIAFGSGPVSAHNLTATFGAEVFYAQLTAMAEESLAQGTPAPGNNP